MKKSRSKPRRKKGEAGKDRRRQYSITTSSGNLESMLSRVRNHPDDIEARLCLAEYYLINDQSSRISEILKPICDSGRRLFCEDSNRARFEQLFLAGLKADRRWPDILDWLNSSEADGCPVAAADYFRCQAQFGLREFEQVVESIDRYLMQLSEDSEKISISKIASPEILKAELLCMKGESLTQTDKLTEAVNTFQMAIEIKPENQQAHIGLARVLLAQGENDQARDTIINGINSASQAQELRLLLRQVGHKVTISACMMVKNEEELLPDALASVRDWVDEIIVVDTGSTDKSIEIAESYGAKIFHQPWENDFSKHRNYTVELATSDWVFIIDADERFDQKDVPLLLGLLNSGEHNIISMNVLNRYQGEQDVSTGSNSIRFWRHDLDLKYEGIVHNALNVPNNSTVFRAPFVLEHLGYDLSEDKMEAKYQRTWKLLEKQLKQNPKNGFAWFNMALALRSKIKPGATEVVQKALDASLKAVKYTNPNLVRHLNTHIMALNHVAWNALFLEDYKMADDYASRALKLKPDYLDCLMLLGFIEDSRQNYQQATHAWQKYLKVQSKYDQHKESLSIILVHSDSRATANYRLGRAWENLDSPEKAKNSYIKSLEHIPGFLDASLRLGRLYLLENRLVDAEKAFQSQLESSQSSAMAATGLGHICAIRDDLEKANYHYEQALKMDSSDLAVLTNCAQFYAESGASDKAIPLLEKILAEDDSRTNLKRTLANAYFEVGKFADAAGRLEQIVAEGRADAPLVSDLGNCYFKTDDYERAEQYYQMALELPDPPSFVLRNLGLTQLSKGSFEDASQTLQTYLEVEPDDLQIVGALADALLQSGEAESALTLFEKLILNNPLDQLAIYKLAECYRIMGHRDSAIMGYQKALEVDSRFAPAEQKLSELTTVPSS